MTQDEPTVGDRIVERLAQARDLSDGQCGVDCTDQRSDCVRDRAYVETGSDDYHRRAGGSLGKTPPPRFVPEPSHKAPLVASLRKRLVILGADLIVSRKASDV